MRVILRWRHFKDRTVNIARKVEIRLWQIIQRDVFGEDLTTIKNGKSVSSSSKIHKFNPFLDEDGVLRVGGRLQQTTWPFERKHPVLLDKHHLTELLVRHHHIERKHQGVEGLVALREIQRHHTKRSTGNPRSVADLVDWAGVKKAFLEKAKGKINQNHADLLSLGAHLFVESIGKGPW